MTPRLLAALAAVAARQHGVLTRQQLTAAGASPAATRHLVRRGELRRVTRTVLAVPGAPSTWHQRLWIAVLDRGPAGAVVSHRAAAALHGLPGFQREPVDVLVHERRSRHASAPRQALASVRVTSWLPAEHVELVEGHPATTLARTIFDLAGLSSRRRLRAGRPYVHEKRVERGLDTALARGLDLAGVADVVATVGRRGRPGTALMRRLLDERGDGYVATESELEDLVLAVLTAYGLPLPERQVVLGTEAADRPIGRVDFVYRRPGLVLEADSRRHHSALADWSHDRWRDAQLAAAGLRVVRVTWHDLVDQPERFAAVVGQALGQAEAA